MLLSSLHRRHAAFVHGPLCLPIRGINFRVRLLQCKVPSRRTRSMSIAPPLPQNSKLKSLRKGIAYVHGWYFSSHAQTHSGLDHLNIEHRGAGVGTCSHGTMPDGTFHRNNRNRIWACDAGMDVQSPPSRRVAFYDFQQQAKVLCFCWRGLALSTVICEWPWRLISTSTSWLICVAGFPKGRADRDLGLAQDESQGQPR